MPEIEVIGNWLEYHTFVFLFLTLSLKWRLKISENFIWNLRSFLCMVTKIRLDQRGSVSIIVQKNFLLSKRSFMVVTSCLQFSAYRWFFLWGNIRRKLKLTAHLHLVPSQKMRGGIPLLYSNEIRYLLYRSTETIRPPPVPGCNSRRLSVSSASDYVVYRKRGKN